MMKIFKKGDALFGFFQSRRNKNGEIVFRPVLGRLFVLFSSLAVVGWLSAALAVSLFVKHGRGFEGGSYVDILFYPWRKEAYQKAWGDEFIERGLELLEEGEVLEGLQLVRIGHIKSPTNREGRLAMADFHSARGRSDQAGQVLREGLQYIEEDDFDYLRTTLRVLLHNEEDQDVLSVASDLLGDEVVITPANQIIALAAGNACFFRGNYDDAESFLVDYELSNHPEGRILLARIDWERGRQQAALDRLERLAESMTEQEEVYVYLSQYYRELGQHNKAQGYAVMRQIMNPHTAAPRIALLYSFHANDEIEKAKSEARKVLNDFSHDEEALLGLGEFAAQLGDVDLSLRTFQAADRNGFSLDLLAILLSEAHLKAGNYQEAIWFLESHSTQNRTFAERYKALLNGIYIVAYLGLGDDEWGENYLKQLLAATNLRAETFLITSRRLLELGRNKVARQLVEHAHRVDPRNQAALIELVQLDLEHGWTGNFARNMEKLLATRKPPRALLEQSITRLGMDEFLFMPERGKLLEAIDEVIGKERDATGLTHS